MSVGAAIRMTSRDEERVIRHAAEFAQQEGTQCFVISVVPEIGGTTDEERGIMERNLEVIAEANASPVMQEGDDVAKTLLAVACLFRIRTLFLQSGSTRRLGRSIAEQLLLLKPTFDVVVVSSE